jgi:hypothetical protein
MRSAGGQNAKSRTFPHVLFATGNDPFRRLRW